MNNVTSPSASRSERMASAAVYIELSKPGITRMVTIAAGVGFAVSGLYHGVEFAGLLVPLIICLLGTAVSSAGANGLNQWAERGLDALMLRTRSRPLPSGRIGSGSALFYSLACGVLGPLLLLTTSPWASVAAALTVALYVLVYTPLKTRSSMATLIGALPGALPVVIGWLAASPTPAQDLGQWPMWSVFLVLLVWQMPHFLAIASMYRADYEAGGFRPIPGGVGDSTLAWVILVWTIAMLAASLAPITAMPDRLSWIYGLVAIIAGLGFVLAAIGMVRSPVRSSARGVFLVSIAYLPLVLLTLVIDAAIRWPAG